MRPLLTVALWIALLCVAQSCREGCKNKSALNYDSRAVVDNGTCLYCSSSITSDTATYFFSQDSAPSQPSVEFILITTDSSIYGNGCRTLGKTAVNNCGNYLRMVNLTTLNASGFINIDFNQNNFDAFFWSGPVQIAAKDTVTITGINADTCVNLTTGTLDANLFNLVFN
jgi:hypothetical protein